MACRQNIQLHLEGVKAYQEKNFTSSLSEFEQIINPTSKILYNIGCCYMGLRNYTTAESFFNACTEKDKYNAAAYFQLGIAQCLLGKFSPAGKNFAGCLTAMRGNLCIDFRQLEMKARLCLWEVKYNLGLLYFFSGDTLTSASLFEEARKLQQPQRQQLIELAIKALQEHDYNYFGESIVTKMIKFPVSAIFGPSKGQMDGLKGDSKLKMANSKVVAAQDDTYEFIGFVGAEKLRREKQDEPIPPEQPQRPKIPPPTTTPPPLKSISPGLRTPPRIPPPSKSIPPRVPPPSKSIPPQLPQPPKSIPPQLPQPPKSIPPQLPQPPKSIPPQLPQPPKSIPPPPRSSPPRAPPPSTNPAQKSPSRLPPPPHMHPPPAQDRRGSSQGGWQLQNPDDEGPPVIPPRRESAGLQGPPPSQLPPVPSRQSPQRYLRP